MCQLMILVDCITIAATFFFNTYDIGLYEFYQYSLHRALGDANLKGHLLLCWLWFVCQADKYVCVVAEKSPTIIFTAAVTHIFYYTINIAYQYRDHNLHDNNVVLYDIVRAHKVLRQPEDTPVPQTGQILFLHRAYTAGSYEHV